MSSRAFFERTNREAEPPKVQERPSYGRGTEAVETHPAYGQIMAFKTQGHTALYGSDFPHHNFVSIEIHESELHRDLNRDWPYAKSRICRFSMSEAQWGHFVSSFSDGTGTQITITERICDDGKYRMMPAVQLRDSSNLYKGEGEQHAEDVDRLLGELLRDIDGDLAGLSKTKQASVRSKIEKARMEIGPNLDFVKRQFGEHLEDRKEKAKTEIMAWAQNTVTRLGMDALAREDGLPLQIEGDDQK